MSSDKPPPYQGSYWVIPGDLLAGSYPGSADDTQMDQTLAAILDVGILSVINLVNDGSDEVDEASDVGDASGPVQLYVPYEDRLEALAAERGEIVDIGHYSIDVGSASADQEMQVILDAIDAEIEGRNSPTLVHCGDGHGRTGLVVGCYLARHGIASGNAVLEKIKELRAPYPELAEHKSPENMVQQRFVTRWKQDK